MKKFLLVEITIASLGVLFSGHVCHAQQAGLPSATPSRLIRDLPVGPKVQPALAPLPPGAVRPTGWLHNWAKAVGDGITGHLDEYDTVFANGWTGKDFKARGSQPGGAGWPLEQCAYWLDGLVRLAYVLHDEKLIEKIKTRLDPVVDGVLKGGTSFVFWKPKSILDKTAGKYNWFNNWAHSHMGRAMVAYYQATGDRRILDALVKVYREYPLPEMPFGVWTEQSSGACNLDPMLDTYAMSGDEQVLKNALEYARRDSFAKHVEHWVAGDILNGHGVAFYEYIRIPAMLYPWTGDKRMLEATVKTLEAKYKRHGLPVGLISSEEHMAGSGSTRSIETCNVACGPWAYHWLLRITGAARYADRMEQVFFNAGPVPFGRDFKIMSYYQTPNRVGNVLPGPGENPIGGGYVYSKVGSGPLCCAGNCNRIVPNFIIHMWMATMDGGLAATLYGPCRLKTTVAGVPVTIDAETAYPFEPSIRMTVQSARPVSFPLHLRIPAWCDTPKVQVNNNAVAAMANENGFVIIKRQWNNGDRITLEFPMQAKIVTGRETPFPQFMYSPGRIIPSSFTRQLAKLTEIDSPYACVYYGPLLFSLPIVDENPNKCAEDAVWNYALNVDPRQIQRDIKVVRQAMPRQWNWQLDAPLKLTVHMEQFDWKPTPTQPLPKEPVTSGKAQTVTLVPYGCTKFRISMFPVTKRLWEDAGDSSTSSR